MNIGHIIGWRCGFALLTSLVLASQSSAQERPIPGPIGPHVNLLATDFAQSKSFSKDDRIVGTHYFYWYDVYSKEHIIDYDGTDALTDHPAATNDFSYKSVAWHKLELSDMIAAGIDVVLPVYWGAPSERQEKNHHHWSYMGLEKLVDAREQMLKENKKPPVIGMFYDTSTLQYNSWRVHTDLTTDYGKQWFYASIRDFFSLIPPRHWAMIDGRPIVVLYSAAFAKNYDQTLVDYLNAQFSKDFCGKTPYLIREVSWNIKADNTCAWGGALGLKNPGVASVGPGYDHSAVPGRNPLIAERLGGKFYEDNWLKLLRRPSNIVFVETWNEFHEGTDVCASKEYGRQYIELTRKYADLFRQGWRPEPVRGKYTGASSVKITLGKTNQELGLRQIEHEDGATATATIADKSCRAIRPTRHQGRYVYFAVDDSFKPDTPMDAVVEVEYFDAAPGSFCVEFDGSDTSAPFNGVYSRSNETVPLKASKVWETAKFTVRGARFLNSQNAGADFRLAIDAPEFYVRRVEVVVAAGRE